MVFEGQDLVVLREDEVREIRGSDIAMIFQDPMTSLNPVLTIQEQMVETIQAHRKVSKEDAQARAIELLDMVGIPNPAARLKSFPHQFSGGMRQRVMIAMALALEPKLLIADEPTTALDVTIQAQVLELLRRLTTESSSRAHPHHPRPRRRRRDDAADQRHVRRLHRRDCVDRRPVRPSVAPLYGRPAPLDPAPRRGDRCGAHPDRGPAARHASSADRLPIRPSLRLADRRLLDGEPDAAAAHRGRADRHDRPGCDAPDRLPQSADPERGPRRATADAPASPPPRPRPGCSTS